MKLKRYIYIGVASAVLLGTVLVSSAENNTKTVVQYNEQVKSSFERLLDSKGVDFVKVTFDNGQWIEMYRDTDNLYERVDYYNSDGAFISRILTTDGGKSIINIGIDSVGTNFEGTPVATRLIQPEDIATQNSELLKVSIIDSYFTTDVTNGLELDWKLAKSKDKELNKYTSKNGNIYIDKATKELVKREVIINGQAHETIEYDKIKAENKEALNSIFNVEAPLSSEKARKNIDLKNIEVKDFNVKDDVFYSNDPNPVG